MRIQDEAYAYYFNKINTEKLLLKVKSELGDEVIDIPFEMVNIVHEFLNDFPRKYWDKNVADRTFQKLNDILKVIKIEGVPQDSWEYFFISLNTFNSITKMVEETKETQKNKEFEMRMYKIPIYVNLLEGCLVNIFKFLIHILNESVDGKDLSKQSKLSPICDVLKKYGFEELAEKVEVDIRNAINHGGVILNRDSIIFQFSKGNTLKKKKVKFYEFNDLIDETYDVCSGIFIGVIKCIILNPKLLESINLENEYLNYELNKLKLSIPSNVCKFIDKATLNSQINVHFITDNPSLEEMLEYAISVGLKCYEIFKEYNYYFIGFESKKMLNSWVRFKRSDIKKVILKEIELSDLVQLTMKEKNIMYFEKNIEEIDENKYKGYSFPIIKDEGWHVNNLKDISLNDRKRFSCNLFINSFESKSEIKNILEKVLEKIKVLFNPPNLKTQIKHGDMEADFIFIKVFLSDRRKNKELFINNENFVGTFQYGKNKSYFLEDGGVPRNLWNKYLKGYETGRIYAWNPNYLIKLV